ncbi:uncharacterized protein MYCFIDRAFT_88504 [Pseudocercospora fijiensis CIRAD86]|uniref:Uncharacterized protein n=1 Tax=Pseudocercospora fijiensis (strain CIRAD86) TaxID=383855 RepID=M3B8H0_PSEFD|nr:uncharacterized protein MYCFIDRAFT_88504 [Pseudocercospora fijiensis CIRAD86]EME85613.1 hypothetical protein MYCFIDRAFT_88504 [Pseudocercospora fijiensis CIRAD86]
MDGRRMVTALVNSVPNTAAADHISNPLRDLPQEARNIFLTLYALFGKELLPALDLLDRSLVTRLHTSSGEEHTCKLYLVRSAQPQTSRNTPYQHTNYYEVRLNAWTCSCPAFAFSAFPATEAPDRSINTNNEERWTFGGLTLGSDMPVWKATIGFDAAQMWQGVGDVAREDVEDWDLLSQRH